MIFPFQTEFRPSKVLIVAKTTRYQMEKRLASSVDDETLHSIVSLNERETVEGRY